MVNSICIFVLALLSIAQSIAIKRQAKNIEYITEALRLQGELNKSVSEQACHALEGIKILMDDHDAVQEQIKLISEAQEERFSRMPNPSSN